MQEFDFLQPKTIDELVAVLGDSGGRIVAGGTDVIPRMRQNIFSADKLVDVSRIAELDFIEECGDEIIIGALTTHDAILKSTLLQEFNPALVAAAASVGCSQTRQRGTLGGNIANASPAADTAPPLLVHDAQVQLRKNGDQHKLPLAEFFVGPGKTKLEPGEFIQSISFKKLSGAWGAAFQKMGKRNGMAIAVVSAAASVRLDKAGSVSDVRIALGSVAPTVVRSLQAEAKLRGQVPGQTLIQGAARAVAQDISPIKDVRSTAEYRQHAAAVLTERALQQAIAQAQRKLS